MPEAVIVAACRTAIGTSFKGTLTDTTALDLAEAVIRESVARTGLAPELFDDVVFGESMQGGGVIGRHAAVRAGLVTVPGLAHNRHCASSLSAIQTAAAGIRAGMDQAVIAGGAESLSTAPISRRRVPGTPDTWEEPWFPPTHPDSAEAPFRDMSITVGWNTARLAGLSRAEMDAWAVRSHQRATAAIDEGRFTREIVPLKVTKDGVEILFDTDEHPRRGTSLERLAALKPIHPEIPDFSITAGNSSGINDAAAAVVVTSDAYAARHGLSPIGVVRAWASVGVDPVRTGLAPIEAIPKALDRAGLAARDVALFEINEAFAAVPLAAGRALGIDEDIVNISGSGCSLGHPVAATGARMVTTLLGDLRRRGGGIGVAAMCAGGGMGSALVVEAL